MKHRIVEKLSGLHRHLPHPVRYYMSILSKKTRSCFGGLIKGLN